MSTGMRSDVEDAHVGRVGCRVPGQARAHRQSTCCPPVPVPRRHPLGTRRRNRQMTGNTACAACSLLAPSSPWAPSPDSQGDGPDKQHVYLRTLSRSSNLKPWPSQLLAHAPRGLSRLPGTTSVRAQVDDIPLLRRRSALAQHVNEGAARIQAGDLRLPVGQSLSLKRPRAPDFARPRAIM